MACAYVMGASIYSYFGAPLDSAIKLSRLYCVLILRRKENQNSVFLHLHNYDQDRCFLMNHRVEFRMSHLFSRTLILLIDGLYFQNGSQF